MPHECHKSREKTGPSYQILSKRFFPPKAETTKHRQHTHIFRDSLLLHFWASNRAC